MTTPFKRPFIISVAVNVLLAGVIAGHFLQPAPSYTQHRQDAIAEVAAQLPPDKAEMLHQVMDSTYKEVDSMKKAMRASRNETTDILSAETFDAEAYQRHVDDLHRQRGVIMQHMATAMMEAASALNQEERTLLAQTLRRYHGYKRKCKYGEQVKADK